MPSIPLELKALIVHELAHDEKALSAVSHVWPETIPYIREHHFKNLDFGLADTLSPFLAVVAGAPAISSVIRSISMITPSIFTSEPLSMISPYAKLMALIMTAPNLEELSMEGANLSELYLVLTLTLSPSNPSTLIKLKTFTIQHESRASSLACLLNVLCSFPHLTTLNLLDLVISEICQIGIQIWGVNANPPNLYPEGRAMWDAHDIEVPKQVPQLTSLCININTSITHLMFLDLLASPKTPFPNIEEITFVDHFLPMCRPRRLPALLRQYKDTLRILYLKSPYFNNETPVLALPPTLEHFKFTVNNTTLLDNFCETLARSALRNVSIGFQYCMDVGSVPDTRGLDKVLVGMRGLDQLNLRVWLHMKKEVEHRLPMCLGKQAEGRLRLVWQVDDMEDCEWGVEE